MSQREKSRSIEDAAIAWVARMDRKPLSATEQAQLEQWLAGDPRRQGAFLRAKAVSLHSQSACALGVQYDPAEFQLPTRRDPKPSVLTWGAGIGIAACLVVTMFFLSTLVRTPVAYATERGEMRRVPLGDGSTAMLNTATSIEVRYDDAQRLVMLREGEAFFEAVTESGRPFIVEAGGQRLSTAGAAFVVRSLADAPFQTVVRHGSLNFKADNADPPGGVLPANTRMSVSAASPGRVGALRTVAIDKVAIEEIDRALAWRDGKLAFHGEDLAAASMAFSRYSDVRIVIADAALAKEPVAGLFAANDPVGFSHAVASIFDAEVALDGNTATVSRSSSQD